MEIKAMKLLDAFPKIPKPSFEVNAEIRSKYRFERCAVCDSSAYVEHMNESSFGDHIKYFCPYCGRYITDSLTRGILSENSKLISSTLFNRFVQRKNNRYWEKDKTIVIANRLTNTKQFTSEEYDIISLAELSDETPKNNDDLLIRIVKNIAYLLIQPGEVFSVGEELDGLICVVFFIESSSDKKEERLKRFNTYLGYLTDDGLLKDIPNNDSSRRYFTLTKSGWSKAQDSMKSIDDTSVSVSGDYFDLRDAKVSESNIGGHNNTVITNVPEKSGFWKDIWKSIIANLIWYIIGTLIILIIGLSMALNWDEIIKFIVRIP